MHGCSCEKTTSNVRLSLKYKSERNARFKVGINLSLPLWPEQADEASWGQI
jgi:hypothetical protein